MLWIIVVSILSLGVGFAGGRLFAAPHKELLAALRRRTRALYEMAEGDVDNVAYELEQLVEHSPGDSTVFLALAALDRRRGRVTRAKAIHRTVLASADLAVEERVAAWIGLGRDLLAQGNGKAAVGALIRAGSLAPRSLATLESLAFALEQAGAWERAAAAWERHERLVEGRRKRDSRERRGHAFAELAYLAMSEAEPRKAERFIERALELIPDSGHVWHKTAQVLTRHSQEPARIADAWRHAWEYCPAQSHAIVTQALTWAQANDTHAALQQAIKESLQVAAHALLQDALERALQITPSHSLDSPQTLSITKPRALICTHCAAQTSQPGPVFRCERCGRFDGLAPLL